MFYEYDNDSSLENIKNDFEKISILKEELSEKRRLFRKFAKEIELDENILFDCIDRYETCLLISCYTFSEQVTKNFYYELIKKDNNDNKYVNSFINKKVPKDKFSPDVRINGIDKLLKEIDKEFGFIITNFEKTEFKIYDHMIKCRHQYAHADNYLFEFDQFDQVIPVLDYLNFEFKMHIDNEVKRKKIKDTYNQIKELNKELKSGKNFTFKNPSMRKNLKEIKIKSKKFIEYYENNFGSLKIFINMIEILDEISKLDMRKTKENNNITKLLSNLSKVI